MVSVSVFVSSCRYDRNPDPHLKGKSNMSEGVSREINSIYCNSAIRSTMIGDFAHSHQVKSLSLNEVNKASGGNYVLLDGSHKHYFYLSSYKMGTLLRKREVIVQDNDGHNHNVSLECAR